MCYSGVAMHMNHSHNLHTKGDYISDKQTVEYLARWSILSMTLLQFKLWTMNYKLVAHNLTIHTSKTKIYKTFKY